MDYTPEQLRTGVLKTCDEIVCEQYLGEMYLQRLLRSTLVGSFALCSCKCFPLRVASSNRTVFQRKYRFTEIACFVCVSVHSVQARRECTFFVTKEVTNKQLFYFAIYNKVVRKHASYCFSQERFFYIKITTIYFTEYQPKRKTSVKKNTYSLKIFL